MDGVTVFDSVLFVCVGNVCRSPCAEAMLRHALAGREVQIASAGLGASAGRGIDSTTQQLLLKAGLDGTDHRARQVDVAMLSRAALILVMERRHLHQVAAIAPQASGKTFLLGKWQMEREIPDPHRQPYRVFEQVHQWIAEGVEGWLPHL